MTLNLIFYPPVYLGNHIQYHRQLVRKTPAKYKYKTDVLKFSDWLMYPIIIPQLNINPKIA